MTESKGQMLREWALSNFLYTIKFWTLTTQFQRKVQALEMICYGSLLGISDVERITNDAVRDTIS